MQKLLPTLLAAIFLAACAPTSVKSNDKTATDNFERNLECQELINDLRDELEFTENLDYRFVDQIFYSPKTNSCLFVVDQSNYIFGERFCNTRLQDAFTNEVIFEKDNCDESFDEFNQIVAEYQN